MEGCLVILLGLLILGLLSGRKNRKSYRPKLDSYPARRPRRENVKMDGFSAPPGRNKK